MMMNKPILIYVTVENEDDAEYMARAVVSEHLAACANIIPKMKSIYNWQGGVQESDEVVLIFKTMSNMFDKVEAKVKELHSYDVPCIVSMPTDKVSKDFAEWIKGEVA